MPWRLAEYLGGGIVWRPILTRKSVRWRRYTIDAALAGDGVEVPDAVVEMLDAVEGAIAAAERVIRFVLGPGELLMMDNHRAIHARTALGRTDRPSNRLMLRSWIRPHGDPGTRCGDGHGQGHKRA